MASNARGVNAISALTPKPCRSTNVDLAFATRFARSLVTSFGDRPVSRAKLDICRARRDLSGVGSTVSIREVVETRRASDNAQNQCWTASQTLVLHVDRDGVFDVAVIAGPSRAASVASTLIDAGHVQGLSQIDRRRKVAGHLVDDSRMAVSW